ncbi:MAG: prepilin-type N-terminal cleavage/methylation domain-containing protein [Candidatus Omnitrophica bacterium]|nr:prepilin-type N-terminal cleavage/methylation domain-containing protein [Candidatus Omnitrophota bacterium]
MKFVWTQSHREGFTLIELLIVVAIIGILAAIAVPNFLNAQVRAKVARAESDIRSIDQAVRMYQLDNNMYPVRGGLMHERYVPLTTPVSYMSSIPLDPFNANPTDTSSGRPKDGNNTQGNYDYWTRYWANGSSKGGNYWGQKTAFPANRYEWQFRGFGPTSTWIANLIYPAGHSKAGEYMSYDASNGLYSQGNIVRYGP